MSVAEPAANGSLASRRALRWSLIIGGGVIGLALLPYGTGLLGALVLFVICAPVHRRLARVLPNRVSAAAVTLGALALLLVPGIWLTTTIVAEAPAGLRALEESDALARLSRTRIGEFDIAAHLAAALSSIVGWLSGRALALFGSVTTALIDLMLAMFGLYYLLVGGTATWRRLGRLLPFSDEVTARLGARFVAVTEAVVIGLLLTAVIQGALVGAGFAIVGLRPAVLWGFVTACVALLPLLGSALVWAPAVAVLAIQRQFGAAVFILVLGGGIASNIDNVIRLVVYRRVSGLHPMATLVGAVAGVRALGVPGAVLGPVTLCYFLELLAMYEQWRAPPTAPVAARPGV
ncbi:MAG TPA: AI-2E family transporter [Gemmatimonadaceae bacterium]|nr:AI-2E family transporter [Gemmatimonadaceae bacterium]